MPSYEPFKAIRAADLRHERASRGSPTEGLKEDLAYRLAIGPKRSSPVQIDASRPSIHNNNHGNKDRPIRSLGRISTMFKKALLSILLIIFLSCILWRYLPTVDKEYPSMRIDNGHDFMNSEIINWGAQPLIGIHEAAFLPEDLTWLHCPDHYKVLDVPKDASDSIVTKAYNLKASRWQNKKATDLSVSEGIPGRAVKILRQSRDILLNPELRARFDSGERSLGYCAGCEICY